MRTRKPGELCNCENSHCNHKEGCGKEAGNTFIDQLGYVCDECAARYPEKYKVRQAELPNGATLEIDGYGDFYYGFPGVLINRINPDNLDNFMEPDRTYLMDGMKVLQGRS